MIASRTLFAGMLVWGLAGCGPKPAAPVVAAADGARSRALSPTLPEADDSPVIARVGEMTVTERELQAAAARRVPANGESLSSKERGEVLDDLIAERQLFLQARALRYDEDPKVQKVMVNTLLREQVYGDIKASDFSDDDLRTYFEVNQSDFVVPEKREVLRIFIKAGDERSRGEAQLLAEELQGKLLSDPSRFKDLALAHSEDPYKRRGGNMGFMSLEGKPGVPEKVAEVVFELGEGEISEVFATEGGLNIVMVQKIRPRVERTFEQMKGSVLRKLKNEAYEAAYNSYVDVISDEYPAAIDQQALRATDLSPGTGLRPMGLRDGDAPDPEPQVGDALKK